MWASQSRSGSSPRSRASALMSDAVDDRRMISVEAVAGRSALLAERAQRTVRGRGDGEELPGERLVRLGDVDERLLADAPAVGQRRHAFHAPRRPLRVLIACIWS